MPGGGGGGGHFHTWGCAAGQGVFSELPTLAQGVVLSFRNWDKMLFGASNPGHPVSMYLADFSGHVHAFQVENK